MIYFCFIESDPRNAVEMKTLRAGDDAAAVQEAAALPFDGRQGHVFDGDRYVGSVATASAPAAARRRPDARQAAYGLGGIYLLDTLPGEAPR